MKKEEFIGKVKDMLAMNAVYPDIKADLDSVIQQAIAEHEAGRWQSFGKKIPYGYAKIMVIFPPEAKQEANIVTYDPDADDYQDGDIWAYVTDLFPEPYQEGGER